jgi:hypothetical protein
MALDDEQVRVALARIISELEAIHKLLANQQGGSNDQA